MTAIGITGSRNGVTIPQGAAMFDLLRDMRPRFAWLNHGDCLGVDELAAIWWAIEGGRLRAHDPDVDTMRAFVCSDERMTSAPYLVRNRAIVDGSRAMIAMPDGPETTRSGTWATIRYARRVGKPVAIVMPDGVVIKEN